MANDDIRLAAAGAGIRLWQVADELGIPDSSLSRKLRHELPTQERERVMSIIRKLSDNRQEKETYGTAHN